MIKKDVLYSAMQHSFRTHNPKFPFPKKHDLDDQTSEFQAAFNEIHEFVNTQEEAGVNEAVAAHESVCDRRVRSAQSNDGFMSGFIIGGIAAAVVVFVFFVI